VAALKEARGQLKLTETEMEKWKSASEGSEIKLQTQLAESAERKTGEQSEELVALRLGKTEYLAKLEKMQEHLRGEIREASEEQREKADARLSQEQASAASRHEEVHCSYTVVQLLLDSCCTLVTLLLHSTVAKLLLHYCR
jgi:hypothetical protein